MEELPFDKDLRKIAADRVFEKIHEFRESLKHFGCGKNCAIPWDDLDFWEPYFVHICEREIFISLPKEVIRYKRKYSNSDYEVDIEEARKGSQVCLARLITWDKRWLFFDWVKTRILVAQKRLSQVDAKFIRSVAEALGKKPGSKIKISGDEREKKEAVLTLVEAALIYHRIGLNSDGTNPLFKKFYQVLEKQEILPTAMYERGFEYFMKFLRRHNLIS